MYRSLQDHWLWTEKRVFSKYEAWNDILWSVSFSSRKELFNGSLVEVGIGQLIRSYETWAKRWGWTKKKVERFFDCLRSDSMIVTDNAYKVTRLTVCNYNTYQKKCPDDVPMTSEICPDDVPIVSRSCPDRVPLNKELKELNKLNIKNITPSRNSGDPSPSEEKKSTPKPKLEKKPYGEFGNVRLTDEERKTLSQRLGTEHAQEMIGRLDSYIEAKGKKYKSHYAAILNWTRFKNKSQTTTFQKPNKDQEIADCLKWLEDSSNGNN